MHDSPATNSGRGLRADVIAAAILIVAIWVPFIVRMAQGLTALSAPLNHDIILQWVPFRNFINASFAAGYFPLWSGQVFAGFPFAAFSHTGVFYPPSWILLTGEYARDVNLLYPVHLCIAALGVFALARRMGMRTLIAAFTAAAYAFTGKPFYFVHFLPATCSNVWVPWLFFSFLGLIKRPNLTSFMGATAFLALQVLGGDVESTAYGLTLGLPAMVWFAGKSGWPVRRAALVLPAFALAALLCLVTLGPLTEYSSHFIRNQGMTFTYFTQRKLPWQLIWSILTPLLKESVAMGLGLDGPFFYWGIPLLGLAFAAGIKRAAPASRGLLAVAVFGILWSFGTIPALDRLQYSIPVLRSMGSPEQGFFLPQLLFALLAGQGLQWLLDSRDRAAALTVAVIAALTLAAAGLCSSRQDLALPAWTMIAGAGVVLTLALVSIKLKPLTRHSALVLAALHLVMIYGLAVAWFPAHDFSLYQRPQWLIDFADRIRPTHFRYIMVSDKGPLDQELVYHAGLDLDLDAIDGWITVPPRDYAELLALADPKVASFVDGKLDHLGINADLKGGKFIDADAMPILDLIGLGFIIDRGVPLKFSSPYDLTLALPDYHRRAIIQGAVRSWEQGRADHPNLWEALLAGPDEQRRWRLFISKGDHLTFEPALYLADNRADAEGTFQVRVHSESGDTTAYQLTMTARPASPGAVRPGPRRVSVDLDPFAGKIIDLSLDNAGPDRHDLVFAWWLPAIENADKPLQRIPRPTPGVEVYFNREALQRAFLVHKAEVLPDDEIMDRLRHADLVTLLNRVFLERTLPGLEEKLKLHNPWSGIPDQARRIERDPGYEVYKVTSNGPGLLFISDQYYPGWRARVEGEERPILKADHCFRAIPMTPGESIVRLSFEPASFRIGLWASLTALAVFIFLLIAPRRRARL